MSFENVKKSVLDLIFPRKCLNCEKEGTYACEECLDQLKLLEKQSCPMCRKLNETGDFCGTGCGDRFAFDQLIVGMQYDKRSFLKKMIVRFKYKFSKELATTLSRILITQLCYHFEDFGDCREQIVIVPVPIHDHKLKQRGFNQAGLLGFAVSKYFDLEFKEILQRNEVRSDQAKLDRNHRLHNLEGTIEPREFCNLSGKVIFLVDDVATTCSTLNECSKVLKKCGASWICGLVIARGQ